MSLVPPSSKFPSGSSVTGGEIGYDQITATVTVTGTSSAAPTTVLTASAYTFDGGPVVATFYAPIITSPTTISTQLFIGIYESGNLQSMIASVLTSSANQMGAPAVGLYRFTPSAGSHTYVIGGYMTAGASGAQVFAGVGGGANIAPAFLRFTKV